MSSSTPIDRRTILKGAAWAAPVIVLATAAPAAVASTPAPPVYSGPAFVVIGAGAGAANNVKIYAVGDGPTRGTGNLAPGARFGWINPTTAKPVTTQTARVIFTPLTALSTPPTSDSLFEKFNGLTFTPTTAPTGSYAFDVRVDPAAADPRAGVTGVISFTVRTNPANRGTYAISHQSGRVGQFDVRSFDTAATATRLTAKPTY